MSSSLQTEAAFEASFKGLLHRQRTTPTPLPVDLSIAQQTAIVTGSNIGLGLEASRQLLKLELAHLIIGVRSQAKGNAAASQLRIEFPSAQISVWILDMESYDSIRKFAEQCVTLSRIDIVILNAGIMLPSYKTAAGTGHELTTQVNYLSTVLLAMLLIPILKTKKEAGASRPPVLSIIGSDLAYWANLKAKGPILPQLDNPKTFSAMSTYANTKLLLTFFVAKLAEFVNPNDVLINLSNPGMTTGTSLGRDGPAIARKMFGVIQYFFARSLEVGASVYLDAALVRGAESHGASSVIGPSNRRDFTLRLVDETMKELEPAGASLPERS